MNDSPQGSKNFAVASFVAGLFSLFIFVLFVTLPGIILGIIALIRGRSMATKYKVMAALGILFNLGRLVLEIRK
jgi:hypothetical protein